MILRHFSAAPVPEVLSMAQIDIPFFKPRGLWLDVDGAWKEWCEENEFHLENLTHVHAVELDPSAAICRISTEDELRAFNRQFAAEWVSPRSPRARYGRDGDTRSYSVDWKAVARDFAGIIIAPYLHSMRHDDECAWYHPWDFASGCVWDAAAVKSIRLVSPQAGKASRRASHAI